MPTCVRCKQVKPSEMFRKRSNRLKTYGVKVGDICRQCVQHELDLQKRYSTTVSEVLDLLDQQGGVCGACGEPFEDYKAREPSIDHCHTTGEVRGVLHHNCNIGIGFFKDDPDKMERVAAYLRGFKGRSH